MCYISSSIITYDLDKNVETKSINKNFFFLKTTKTEKTGRKKNIIKLWRQNFI